MTTISYTNQFSHKDWIDFVDSIQAGGDNGINARMHAIETEFNKLATVIAAIGSSIVPIPPTVTLTFAPAFSPNVPNPAWQPSSGIAAKASGATGADGWMQVRLPDGVLPQIMTVYGTRNGNVGSFNVQLARQPLGGGAFLTLSSIPLDSADANFQVTSLSMQPGAAAVDNSQFKYVVLARIVGADGGSAASLSAIQILCKTS